MPTPLTTKTVAVLSLGLLWCFAGCSPKRVAPPRPAAITTVKTNVVSATNQLNPKFVSVFEDLPSSKARDPFFPDSHRREPVARVVKTPGKQQQPAQDELHLRGVVSAPNHRQAVINNTILGEGEEDSIRVSDGTLRVLCVKIGSDFAIVQVKGESQPKRLILEEKHY